MPFSCTICAEESTAICARCTQDTCRNHLCEKCKRCSDCCECEVLLDEDLDERPHIPVRAVHAATAHTPLPELDPEEDEEAWQPPPDPDPLPPEDPEPGPVAP
jgi:hypothetical protein